MPETNTIAPNKNSQGDMPFAARAQKESRALVKLGGPILIVQVLQVAVVTLDTIMAGRYSALDLSGVAIAGSIWFPVYLLLTGILSALTPTIAQLHGAKDYKNIAPHVFQAACIALLLIPITLWLMSFIKPLLGLIGAEQSIRPITANYLSALMWGLPAILFYSVLRYYSDGVSLTKPAVVASVIGIILNGFLNYVLIYGKLGFPELGGEGCGWASAIAYWVMFLYMLLVVAIKKDYRQFYLFQSKPGWHSSNFYQLLKIGLPIGGAYFVESSMFGVVALFLAPFGPTTVAAHQIALNFSALIFMVPLSLSMVLTIRIGFLIGAKQPLDARFTAFYGVGLALSYALISASFIYIFRIDVANMYNNEPAVVSLAATLLLFAAAFQFGDALQVIAAGALRGYKDTRITMYIMIVTFWFFGLPLGYILGLTDWLVEPMHAQGFWSGLVIGLFLAGFTLVFRLIYTCNKNVLINK